MKNNIITTCSTWGTKWVGIMLILVTYGQSAFAVGTKQVSPTADQISALFSAPDINSGSFFNAPIDNRVYFNIKDFNTEGFYFGFDWRAQQGLNGTANDSNPAQAWDRVWYRILDPAGNVVFGPALAPITGNGKINTYTEAVQGPNINGSNAQGYAPLSFTPTVNGEHWIEYWLGTSTADATPVAGGRALSALFDFTVARRIAPHTVQDGRVFCSKWGMIAVAPVTFRNFVLASASPSFIAYTSDRVLLKISFAAGFQPIAYDVAINDYGAQNTGDRVVDRRSRNSATSPSLPGGYRIFLDTPDNTLYPVSPIPESPTFGVPLFEGCDAPFLVNFNLPARGDVRLLLDLNGVPGFQPNSTDVLLEGFDFEAGPNQLPWNGKNGQGVDVVANTNLNLKLTFLQGRFNLPIYDAEHNKGGLFLETIAPVQQANRRVYWDDSQLINVGIACGGSGDNANNLTGAGLNNSLVGTITPAHAWNGDGNLSQTIPAPAVFNASTSNNNDVNTIQCDDFGNVRVINTWGWGIEKEANTIGIRGCPDLTVAKVVNKVTPAVGEVIQFTLTAQNIGPVPGTNVQVLDAMPEGLTLIDAVPATGTWTSPNWNIPSLAANASTTMTIRAFVNCSGYWTNVTEISGSETDSNPNNNAGFAIVTPRGSVPITALNTCPAELVNLTTRVPCNVPSGAIVTWHTGPVPSNANRVANPAAVAAGTYYAAFFDSVGNCYSPTSTIVTAVTVICCPAQSVNFPQLNQN